MPRLKILHLISGLDLGGTEKNLALLAPYLQQKHEVKIVCLGRPTKLSAEVERKNISLVHLNLPALHPLIFFKLSSLLKHEQPDAVITYLLAADLWGRLAGRSKHIPVISAQRSSLYQREYLRLLEILTGSLVKQYVVQTRAMQQRLAHILQRPLSNFSVIPNAVLPPPLTGKTLTLPPTAKLVTCVSNLRAGKGHDLLLQAWPIIQKSYPQTHLALLGDGPLRQELNEVAQKLPAAKQIHFLGSQEKIGAVLRQTDIFVLPTRAEGMSNALLEALAAGKACLASDIAANKSLIETGINGELFRNGDSQALGLALNQLLADPKRCLRLGQAAAAYTQSKHHPEIIALAWQELITGVTNHAA